MSHQNSAPAVCRCGATPIITERALDRFQVVQVICECGRHGSPVTYRKPRDRERTMQAAADGWDLAG